jgi:hypothetical protein
MINRHRQIVPCRMEQRGDLTGRGIGLIRFLEENLSSQKTFDRASTPISFEFRMEALARLRKYPDDDLPGQPCRLARHEPAHCIVVDDQVPEPDPIASFPVTVATWPKRWNAKSPMPRLLISPEASISVSPAELTRPPDTAIIQ